MSYTEHSFHTQTNVYFMIETYFRINNKSYANNIFIWYDQSSDDINVVSSEHALFSTNFRFFK